MALRLVHHQGQKQDEYKVIVFVHTQISDFGMLLPGKLRWINSARNSGSGQMNFILLSRRLRLANSMARADFLSVPRWRRPAFQRIAPLCHF